MKIKYGVFDKQGRKIDGVLGVDGKEVYIEINGKSYPIAELVSDYDGSDIVINVGIETDDVVG